MSHRHISQLSLHTAQISLMFHSPLTSTLDLPSQCYLIQSHCAASAYSSATLSSASMTSQYHCSNTSQPRKSNLASNVNTRHVRQITQTLQSRFPLTKVGNDMNLKLTRGCLSKLTETQHPISRGPGWARKHSGKWTPGWGLLSTPEDQRSQGHPTCPVIHLITILITYFQLRILLNI